MFTIYSESASQILNRLRRYSLLKMLAGRSSDNNVLTNVASPTSERRRHALLTSVAALIESSSRGHVKRRFGQNTRSAGREKSRATRHSNCGSERDTSTGEDVVRFVRESQRTDTGQSVSLVLLCCG